MSKVLDRKPVTRKQTLHQTDVRTVSGQSPIGNLDADTTVPDRTFLEIGGYRAIVSLGAIRPGHTLVVPSVEAVRSTSALSMLDHLTRSGSHDGFESCFNEAHKRLCGESEQGVLVFEHGGLSADYSSMCGTCFPHLHLLPVGGEQPAFREAAIRSCRFKCDYVREFRTVPDFFRSARGDGEYLLAADHTGVSVLWAGPRMVVPSQELRHTAQTCLGLPLDRWQDEPGIDGAILAARNLRKG